MHFQKVIYINSKFHMKTTTRKPQTKTTIKQRNKNKLENHCQKRKPKNNKAKQKKTNNYYYYLLLL